jgi:hypothetical protein
MSIDNKLRNERLNIDGQQFHPILTKHELTKDCDLEAYRPSHIIISNSVGYYRL